VRRILLTAVLLLAAVCAVEPAPLPERARPEATLRARLRGHWQEINPNFPREMHTVFERIKRP
jgi:hypothetical protein